MKLSSVSHARSAFNDDVRYNDRMAREGVARCYMARHGVVTTSFLLVPGVPEVGKACMADMTAVCASPNECKFPATSSLYDRRNTIEFTNSINDLLRDKITLQSPLTNT